MKEYGKTRRYNLYGCHHCLYWKGKKTGCTYEDGCCAPIPQKPPRRNGVEMKYDEPEQDTVSECMDCPYGRDSPCIGWCTKGVMRSVGLLKERDKDNV